MQHRVDIGVPLLEVLFETVGTTPLEIIAVHILALCVSRWCRVTPCGCAYAFLQILHEYDRPLGILRMPAGHRDYRDGASVPALFSRVGEVGLEKHFVLDAGQQLVRRMSQGGLMSSRS